MKRCTKCGVEQPLDNFYRAPECRDGFRGDCKACFAARRKQWYHENREREIARVKAWQESNREHHLANLRKRRQRPEVKARERAGHLKRKFGITPTTYDEMLAAQDGACAICERMPEPDRTLHVDHEHVTKRVRGLLCFRCNNALGDFGDDPRLLRRAIDYVERAPAPAQLPTPSN